VLELFHPSGSAPAVTILGAACPSYLYDATMAPDAPAVADAVVLAPDAGQCRTRGWLECAVETVARTLRSNGVAYVMVPRPWRRSAVQLLVSRGLFIESTYIHLAQGARTHYFVPCDPLIVRRLLPALSAPRRSVLVANLVWSVPGAAAVARRGWPITGMLFRRPGARPALEWVAAVKSRVSCAKRAVIRCRSVGSSTHAVISMFGDHNELAAVLKVPLTEAAIAERQREAVMASRLREAASRAGAVVPVANYRHERRPFLHLEPMRGIPAAHVLQSSPERLVDIVHDVGRWLERWHALTARPGRATASRLASEILEPARAIVHQLSGGARYLQWLEARCALLEGAHLPFVASHNDLTMSNVLVTDAGIPAVLDWEGAREDGLPLVDLFYSAAAACRAARARGDVVPALIEAFDGATALGRDVAAIAAATAKGLGLSLEMVELLKHTAAVQHAADEQRRSKSHSRPFLQLVGWLARSQVSA
jgi:hypothetical protein